VRNPNRTVIVCHHSAASLLEKKQTNWCAGRDPIEDAGSTEKAGTEAAYLSEVLVDASEVGGAVAVVVHDVAAQLPDGPLELVAVELELREPAPDAVERVQQRVGLLPHALLHGRHHGVLGVEAAVLLLLRLRLPVGGGHERPHQPLVLQAVPGAAAESGSVRQAPREGKRKFEIKRWRREQRQRQSAGTSRRRGWS